MQKKKVLFLYHGGTIGQVLRAIDSRPVLVPPEGGEEFEAVCKPIIEQYDEKFTTDFEVITTKDSTNLSPNDWERLIFRVQQAQDKDGYDAVGIAHGTDTMTYSATALALALHGHDLGNSGLRIPVCITGSQLPIYDKLGDGQSNLARLFATITEAMNIGVGDVLINFDKRVLLGCRTVKVSERQFDAFASPAFPDVGEIDGSGVHLAAERIHIKLSNDCQIALASKFGRGVVSHELTPGLEPSLILRFIQNGGIHAMILKSFGEGNVCCEGEYNLLPTIKEATESFKVPIFLTTKFVGGRSGSCHYETGFSPVKAGAISCFDHTDVAVEVKVRWLIGNGICSSMEDFRNAMATSYAGEVEAPTS